MRVVKHETAILGNIVRLQIVKSHNLDNLQSTTGLFLGHIRGGIKADSQFRKQLNFPNFLNIYPTCFSYCKSILEMYGFGKPNQIDSCTLIRINPFDFDASRHNSIVPACIKIKTVDPDQTGAIHFIQNF